MGIFGPRREPGEPHPRREPRYPGPLTLAGVEEIFRDCVDFTKRPVALEGGPALTLCYLSGMVKMERVSDYVLRPLAQDKSLAGCADMGALMKKMEDGALYNLSAAERTTLDQAAFDLVSGWCLLFFPGESAVLSFFTGTEEKRSISAPATRRCSRALGTPLWRACAPTPPSSAATSRPRSCASGSRPWAASRPRWWTSYI